MNARIISAVLWMAFAGTFPLGAQNITREDYIRQYSWWAVDEMIRSGIPASVTMAQGLLESDNGNSTLAVRANNHFGIKCHGWKGKKLYHDDDEKNECFRRYRSARESYADHTDFLMNSPRYSFLFELDHTDYKGWAVGLKKAGYATSPGSSRKITWTGLMRE
jgi:flagellum-specific peptidoglycan hydrolase FlgJ